MAHKYPTEADFYRYCPEAANYLNPTRSIIAWGVESGSQYVSYGSGAVSVLFAAGEDLGSAEANKAAVDANGEWYYDSALDALYYYNDTTSPNDMDMQASEDRATYITAMLENASRLIDSLLDARFMIPILPNKSGTYDEVIIQVTCYKLAEIITLGRNEALNEKYQSQLINDTDTGLIQMLNDGRIKLEVHIDPDSSRGEIKQVTVAGGLNIVRTWGEWSGRRYDNIKILITTAGVIGTGAFTSYGFDETNNLPKNLALVSAEVIDGNLQHIGGGVYVQFMGDSSDSASLNDEWEMEVWNKGVEVSQSIVSADMVRS